MAALEFRTIEPKILYFGTPVALGRATNLAPMSSFWALGWTLVLVVLDGTKTAENLARHLECVVNIPSPELWKNVEGWLRSRETTRSLRLKQSNSASSRTSSKVPV
jgi:flavin reductase (DIM6/NTAB) family NADH-FMN oxidoreductase RutF